MATGTNTDIFHAVRSHVKQTLKMAEAQSKIANETRDLLSQLLLTRRGDGEIVLDMSAWQRLKATDNQWMDKERHQQDRFVNPTRLPQLVPGLQGLSPTQYLSFVQRPLERNGDNAVHLCAQTLRYYDQYSDREMASERNKLFGRSQRYIAKLLLNELLSREHDVTEEKELDALRNATSAQAQFELAAKVLGISTTQVMNRLFKYAIALTFIETIQNKALQIHKAKTKFEGLLRKLAASEPGPTAKTRIKEIYLGFQKDLKLMSQEIDQINQFLKSLTAKMNKDNFDDQFIEFHRIGARLDAIASRWIIIISEANSNGARTPVEKIKGMHTIYTH
ncbi:MAG: hypothetical protein ACNI26_17650 [Terasakiella sp.]|uniref:hypothetical protein n=1 Tax=unclassified Terasakiella TaxID=2614952 RepID=UPI003B007A27